ncbi:Peptidase M23 [Syntrophobotulus glycolicus DSM 8271]|uniref:Peptidase M23 n=1 Tax=Syntrophobotulus glycolicus (strain DSM 8271 / FlGlyR) TaxID=645991 RepID=F0SYH8_SYNGF|nr:M23 family metallopeptidase [Syntrophobotulus glycolicus]ADY57090.1 Peptidase M23 [Syntrophobotulus glycolicus DSM 8271]
MVQLILLLHTEEGNFIRIKELLGRQLKKSGKTIFNISQESLATFREQFHNHFQKEFLIRQSHQMKRNFISGIRRISFKSPQTMFCAGLIITCTLVGAVFIKGPANTGNLNVNTAFADGNACALTVNDKILAIMASPGEVDQVLAKYLNTKTQPSEENLVKSAAFVDRIDKISITAQPEEIKSADEVLSLLTQGNEIVTNYTIKENDSLWLIARNNDMLTKEVLSANSSLTEDSTLQPGQVIKLAKTLPYISIKFEGEKTVAQVVPFDVQSTIDRTLNAGATVIKQEGKDGSKTVTYSYAQTNDKITEKKVIKEEITAQPVKQIVAMGPSRVAIATIAYEASRGSGSASGLSSPLQGPINSYYGYRWGGFHNGVDIGGDTGQPYAAAASGKVISAGWSGGYGYMILIDHGDGVETRYAHSSKLAVSAGQSVKKGQVIGYVGRTGNATGPHLHFEVIINGGTVNPLKYI